MLLVLSLAVSLALPQLLPLRDSGKLIVGYLPNFRDLASLVDKIDYSKLTHINVAFENPTDDAGDLSFSSADAALIEKAHAKNVKVLVSIGGGGAAENKKLNDRYFDLQSDAKREAFVVKLAD